MQECPSILRQLARVSLIFAITSDGDLPLDLLSVYYTHSYDRKMNKLVGLTSDG